MLPAFLLALREGLEAALIVGIVLGALRKMNRDDLQPVVWAGTLTAVAVSAIAAIVLYQIGISLEGKAEEIFEGITMLLAAVVLTWMILWMRYQAKSRSQSLTAEIQAVAGQRSKQTLFAVAFLAIVREGIELALFLAAASFTSGGQATIWGAVLGLVVIIGVAWALFNRLIKLDMARFFKYTSIVLILFAAGLVAHGVHELNEAGLIAPLIEHVWNINPLLDENSFVGELLKTLFGYNGNPSLTEVLAYLGYFAVLFFGFRRQQKGMAMQQVSAA
ncbi:MAG: FTR1 family iron permease [Anaerolineales bacterium]|nr:FTR1 family iron permease [Anaerolineales bacterium]MCB0017358.1 FTR1 family iron permease [Anaerolineales bacterium]MCB0028202.1 FTR1 family iron permease [Anaerolineales bacterium]MCB8961773.1 FTR1 family iron permease [Ardenticatenales bacterium]